MTFESNESLALFSYYFEEFNKKAIASGKKPISLFRFLFGRY